MQSGNRCTSCELEYSDIPNWKPVAIDLTGFDDLTSWAT